MLTSLRLWLIGFSKACLEMKQSGLGQLVVLPKTTPVMQNSNLPERFDHTSETSPVADNTRTTSCQNDHSGNVLFENSTDTTSHRPGHELVHCIPLHLPLLEAEISFLSKGFKFVPLKPSVNKYVIHDYQRCFFFFSLFEMDGSPSSSSKTSK